MIIKSDLKDILRENHIKVSSWMGKQYLVNLAKDHGLWPDESSNSNKPRDPRFDTMKGTKRPRKVCVEDVKTGEIHNLPSIYKTSKSIRCCPQSVTNWNGRVWKDKYKITIP